MKGLLDWLIAASIQDQYGYEPFDPAKHAPRDIGLGGPSTEYLATEFDPNGKVMNFPTIWWDKSGRPTLLDPGKAYQQALTYENNTGKAFPRYPNIGAAEFAAMNRSALGGGENGPLATTLLGLLMGQK